MNHDQSLMPLDYATRIYSCFISLPALCQYNPLLCIWEHSLLESNPAPSKNAGGSCTSHAEWLIAVFFTMTICIFINMTSDFSDEFLDWHSSFWWMWRNGLCGWRMAQSAMAITMTALGWRSLKRPWQNSTNFLFFSLVLKWEPIRWQ